MSYLPFCRSLMFVAAAIVAASFAPRFGPAPKTSALAAEEAQNALHCDWLFQAMGEPLAERAAKEIVWAEQLADRLSHGVRTPDLSAERVELAALKKRLDDANRPDNHSQVPAPARRADAAPNWIWYPEGNPTEDCAGGCPLLPLPVRNARPRSGRPNCTSRPTTPARRS